MKYYIKAESEDNAEAAFNLGLMSETGKGIAIDYSLAEKYYNRSLKLNSAGYIAVLLATKKLRLKIIFNNCFQFKKQIGIFIAVVAGLLSLYFCYSSKNDNCQQIEILSRVML